MSFTDYDTALDARDVFTKMMIKVLDTARPPYIYGTVQSITPSQNKCSVLLTGDTVPVDVKYGAIRPAFVGQVVRVEGLLGDRFIADVIGGSVLADAPTSALVAPTLTLDGGYRQVTAYWTAVTGAAKYEVQFADDVGITVNVRTFQTTATQIILQPLNGGTTIYSRVRALTSDNLTGPWSTVQSDTIDSFPATPLSDGNPPGSSPQPVITPGIGFLLAEWVGVSNVDITSYEVHVSTTSGFTPSAATKVGETTGTFYFIRSLPSGGGTLVYGTTYFVRLIAKDRDGSAAVGAQGSGAPIQVQTGDVGRIATSEIGDGNAPASSPSLASGITNGIGYLYAKWDHVANADATTYEVHVSTTTGFTPSSNTLVGTTPSNFFFIRKQGPGGSPPNGDLVYGTTYYVKLIAKDIDGQAAAGVQGSGTPVKAGTGDIAPLAITATEIADDAITTPKIAANAVTANEIAATQITATHMVAGTITAASGIIADAAIATAKIQDAAITNLKVADAAISSAKIQDLAVGTAKIADAAISTAKIGDAQITTAKIADAQITSAKIVSLAADKITAGTIGAHTIIVGASGILKSSNYVAGSSGWQIDGAGNAEFFNAVLRGTYKSAFSGPRVEIQTGASSHEIRFYHHANADGTPGWEPGYIRSGTSGQSWLQILAPVQDSASPPAISMYNSSLTRYITIDGVYNLNLTAGTVQIGNGTGSQTYVSGYLNVPNSYLSMGSRVDDNIIRVYGTSYTIGIRGGTLLFKTDDTIVMEAPGRAMTWNSNGLYLPTGWFRVTSGSRGIYDEQYGSGWELGTGSRVIKTYNDSKLLAKKGSQAGYNDQAIVLESNGQDQCGISGHNPGYNAPIMKSHWSVGDKWECRNSVDSNFGYWRGFIENMCDITTKYDLRRVSVHTNQGEAMRGKLRKVPVYRFKRPKTPCSVCGGDGIITEKSQMNSVLDVHPEWADEVEELESGPMGEQRVLRRMTVGRVCPNCEGGAREYRPPWVVQNEDTDYFGTVAQDWEAEFPEIIGRGGDDGKILGIDVGGAIGLILAMSQEQEDEIIDHRGSIQAALARAEAAEQRAAALEAKVAANEARLATLERGRPTL